MVHTLQFSTFSPLRKPVKFACWGPPTIPRQGTLTLPCQTLHRWSNYAPLRALIDGGIYRLGKGMPLILESVRKMRSRPMGARKRGVAGGPFQGFGGQPPTSVLHECVYTSALLATIVLCAIGIPAAHENSPGMRRGQSHAGSVMRNDRSPFSGVQDKSYRPPRFRVRKGPFYQGI